MVYILTGKEMTVGELKTNFEKQLEGFYSSTEIKNFFNYILSDLLEVPKLTILSQPNKQLGENILGQIPEIVLKLKNNEPLQYILGKTEFYGLTLNVNPSVLIPRPETEELVDWIIKENKGKKLNILDVCTGSGCIALALKQNIPQCSVTALDDSEAALEVAKGNARDLKLDVKFMKADALKLVNTLQPSYDIIVSNPPYVTESEKHFMQKNVLQFEPHMALFVADNDPLIFYNAIADFVKSQVPHSKPLPLRGEAEGNHKTVQVYFEINEGKAMEISNLLGKKGFKDIVVRKDINGKDRMLKCTYIC